MEEVSIKGKYTRTIFQNNSTGYTIGLFKVHDTSSEALSDYLNRTITFTGYFHDLNEIDTYIMYGNLVSHEKYGEQFSVTKYERCKPEEKNSIIEFLTSGLFKGIGEKKAKAIVDVLGSDTLKIILEQPDNLILIPGITKTNVDVLHKTLKNYESSYEAILKLESIGFSTKDSMIIYNKYKAKTLDVIDIDIYKLVDDLIDINFKKVDVVALNMGIKKDDLIRVKASITYIMDEVCNAYGHSYLFYDEIFGYLSRVLGINIDYELFDKALVDLDVNNKIVIKNDRYYLKDMYDAETLIVKRFRLLSKNEGRVNKKIDLVINDLEDFYGIKYNDEQKEAIKNSYLKDFLIITGGPGTGKTTIMKGITELIRQLDKLSYEKLQQKIALLAPTGRAAKRMTESTGLRASTIHRFLKWQKETNKFQVNERNKSDVEIVIIDEASMIDTYLLASLLKGISANCRVIMVGDDHQLPSVGPGQVLHDLIDSEKLPVIKLEQLYRQGKDSNIISLAYDIRNGSIDEGLFNEEEDLTFIKCDPISVINNVMEICNTYKDYSYKDFQVLAPMYKGLVGIDEINKSLQDIFNPKSKNKKEIEIGEVIFREGDKVIQLTNMPDDNVYNGDIGIISRISTNPKKEIEIDFDNNTVRYTPANFINFRLAYAISIHKAQGSEFDIVVMPMVKNYNKMLYRKLVYTGVTRSKKKLFIIGDLDSLKIAVNNTSTDIRRTTVKDYLINGIK